MKKIKFIRTLATAVIFLAVASVSIASERVTILHFNDLHGHVENLEEMAAAIERVRAENKAAGVYTLVFNGGDMISGTPFSSRYRGEAEEKAMDAMGIDALVVGNHDFDFGRDVLERMTKDKGFKALSANVRKKDTGKLLVDPYAVFDLAPDLKIAVIGITHPGTALMTTPESVADLVFEDPVKTAKKYTRKLKKENNIVIALTHEGVDNDARLAKKDKNISLIVGGHDHVREESYCIAIKKTIACETPANGTYLGRIDFTVNGKEIEGLKYSLVPLVGKTEDPKVKKILAPYIASVEKEMKEVIGVATKDYIHKRADPGVTTDMGRFVTTALKESTGADIALYNRGGIRGSIKKGNITRGMIEEIAPFDNRVVLVSLKGADIDGMRDKVKKRGKSIQIAGVKDDERLDPGRTYLVVTDTFLYGGGEGCIEFKTKGKLVKDTGVLTRDMLIGYIKKEKKI
jgi:2',3'-cyclic-nucleotide 2'-phosphodiesterase (5'-nucleotidase family)